MLILVKRQVLVPVAVLRHIKPILIVDEVHFLDVVDHVNCHNFVAITPP